MFLGAGIIWLLLRFKYEAKRASSDEKLRYLEKELETNRTDIEQKEKQIIDLNRSLSGKEADLKNIRERLLEQKSELEKIQDKFRLEFKNLWPGNNTSVFVSSNFLYF
ncbi:MAG: hypothetical protein IMY71_04425 [Bacteroidetes bacterium]|nr:hypothetical protein [Bacteroidota bacterium]